MLCDSDFNRWKKWKHRKVTTGHWLKVTPPVVKRWDSKLTQVTTQNYRGLWPHSPDLKPKHHSLVFCRAGCSVPPRPCLCLPSPSTARQPGTPHSLFTCPWRLPLWTHALKGDCPWCAAHAYRTGTYFPSRWSKVVRPQVPEAKHLLIRLSSKFSRSQG